MARVQFDPLDPQLCTDPDAVFERLRNDAPVLSADIGGQRVWLVSRYADVAQLIADPKTTMNAPGSDVPTAYGDGPAATLWRNAISMMDPPQHGKARRIISKPFSHRRVEGLRPLVSEVVAQSFVKISAAEFEATDLASEIPMRVICRFLGIPTSDWPKLQAWTNDFLRIFVPNVSDAEEINRVHTASQNFIDYFGALIDDRKRHPREDMTSDFVALIDKPNGITRLGLIGALRGLLTAGFETTAATISAMFLGFSRQPEQLALLRQQPSLIPGAVDEFLRWETPVRLVVRYLGEDIVQHGVSLRAGEPCWLLVGSANHDPRQYKDPQSLDVARGVTDHYAFGGGRHFCVGAYLAKLELQLVLQQLISRCDHIELCCDTVARRQNFQFPSIESLRVALVN